MATATAAPAPGDDDFQRQLKAAVDRINGHAERTTYAYIVNMFNEIQTGGPYGPGTPVANPRWWKVPRKHTGGYARANWFASLGTPLETVLDEALAGAEGADAAAREALIRNAESVALFRLGDSAFLTNSAPYINRLEFGWSQQAPTGMVREALRHAEDILRDTVAHLNQGGQDGR